MSKPENPPAFPVGNDANVNGTMGMSLRDWFAGQALAGLFARMGKDSYEMGIENHDWSFEAVDAYNIADAMISQRIKEESDG